MAAQLRDAIPEPLKETARWALGAVLAGTVRLSRRRVGLALVYHAVGPADGDPAREVLPALAAARLEGHLRHLTRWYRVVDAAQLQAEVGRRRRGGRVPVALTFDDDLRSHVEYAAPLLERHGLRATFFLTGAPGAPMWAKVQAAADAGVPIAGPPGLPDGPEHASAPRVAAAVQRLAPAERDRLEADIDAHVQMPQGAWLSAGGVARLTEAGHTIGFHTRRHHALPLLDDRELERALRDGRDVLPGVAGAPPTTFAYPYGAWDARAAAAVRRAGFSCAFTTEQAAVTPATDPWALGRLEPHVRSRGHFALQLARALAGRPER